MKVEARIFNVMPRRQMDYKIKGRLVVIIEMGNPRQMLARGFDGDPKYEHRINQLFRNFVT
jgi:hypothetical protein